MPSADSQIGLADRSLAAQIYDSLKEQIIDGRIPGGTWLRERELAAQFNVSRIPLREALPQLELDGFIIAHPRRGAVVRNLTLGDAEEVFDVRSSLEVLGARLAAQRVAAGSSPEPLLAALRRADEALETGDPQGIADSNSAVHDAITDLAANRLLASMMAPLSGLQRWLFGITTDRDQRELGTEHHDLVNAIAEGNVEFAGSLAFAHVERARRESMPLLAERLPPAP